MVAFSQIQSASCHVGSTVRLAISVDSEVGLIWGGGHVVSFIIEANGKSISQGSTEKEMGRRKQSGHICGIG